MKSYSDRATRAQVLQITDGPAINHPTYFLQSSFFPGGREMFFTSYRTGSPQLFEVSLDSGEFRQLTSGSPIHPYSAALHPGGDEIVVTRGGSLWTIHRQTLAEQCIVDHPGAQFGECSISADGQWLTAAYKQGSQCGLAVGRYDGSGWHEIPFPRTVIHPQFHPIEPDWIEFSGDPAPRMHRVRTDGTGLECLHPHGNDEFIVHETFLGLTGDLVFTIWPRALCRMDWTTRQITTIVAYNCWHIAPNRKGTRVLCDTNHPDEGLQVIDAASGARRQLCLSESSNQGTQWKKSHYALAADFEDARKTLSWMENASDTVYGPQWTHPASLVVSRRGQSSVRQRPDGCDPGVCRWTVGVFRIQRFFSEVRWIIWRNVAFNRFYKLALLAATAGCLSAQGPGGNSPNNSTSATAAAIAASKEEPAAVARGAKLYATNCGGCHGANAKGGPGAPDLVRSVLVLDDEKGILIAPVLREGRPDQGMPKPKLTEPQISDIVAWLHVQTYAAGHRATYSFLDVVTGDPKKGAAYFNTTGKCNTCHSVTGDLAGIGKKYEPFALQSRWLQPRSISRRPGRGGPAPQVSQRGAMTVTVTLPSGQPVSGTLDHIDDFNVALHDSSGEYHSFARNEDTPKVEVHDPLKVHRELLAQYTDADIHNVTAFLVTLK